VTVSVAMIAGSLRLFVWPFEAIWMSLLWLTFQRERSGHVLRWLPIFYDQFIVLPLPFLGKFLAGGYKYNEAGTRQAIAYLTTHSRQQKSALHAQTLIALERMANCSNTQEIASARNELRWLSEPSPPELGPLLPALLDVSQGVRAAGEATTRYRQAEMLKRQSARLRELRERLVTGDSRTAATYGGIIDRWTGIIEGAARALAAASGTEREIRPVYLAGPHLRPGEADDLFKGRGDLFGEIENALLAPRPPVLLLWGQRRTGKTSLMAYLPMRLPAEIVPLRVNVQNVAAASSLAGVAFTMAQEMVESARRGRSVILPAPRLADFQVDPFVILGEWMREAERALRSRRFFLCLDEYQRLEEVVAAGGNRAVLHFLRDTMEHRERWSLLFAGSSPVEETAAYWSDFLINVRQLHISYLSDDESRELIERPVPGFEQEMQYSAAAREAILTLTRGQPFLIQLLCGELVNLLNRERRQRAEEDDVARVLPAALEHGGQYFDELWSSTTPDERALLAQVATGAFRGGDPAVLARLCRRELLEPVDGAFRYQAPLIARWVRSRSQLDSAFTAAAGSK